MVIDPVRQALDLAARGQPGAAAALLARAGEDGNVDAIMQLAVWHLVGTEVPRDVPAARALLRRAVEIGHVDAALMEVALVANGSGGPADWRGALDLLRVAGANDDLARAHLALIDAMALGADGAPTRLPPPERLSGTPDVVRYRRLLSPAECAHVAGVVQPILEPSHIVDPVTGRQREHPIRTSDGAVIGPTREDLVVRAINRRIAAISDTDIDQGEALSVLRYRPAQQFRMHHDAIGGVSNQRIKTVLVYLNDAFTGGETYFPAANLTIRPGAGDAIVLVNTVAGGSADPAANHAGLPVKTGIKWLATRWIRARTIDPWNLAATAS